MADQKKQAILHQFDSSKGKNAWKEIILPAGIILAIIAFGVTTGYFLANRKGSLSNGSKVTGGSDVVNSANEVGIKDDKKFPDKAQGKIEVNDSKTITEGSHKLIRSGGESQTAYLTSSAVDLNQFIGKCVEVWGETFTAEKAGWFMDIGYVQKLGSCPEGI